MFTAQIWLCFILMMVCLLLITAANCQLIPRILLFNDPKYSAVTLSPDGNTVAFLAPNEVGFGTERKANNNGIKMSNAGNNKKKQLKNQSIFNFVRC